MPGARVDSLSARLRRRAAQNASAQLMIDAAYIIETVEQIINDPNIKTDGEMRAALRKALFKPDCGG